MCDIELWKPIPDYEGLYEVSTFGHVRSMLFKKIKILKPGKTKGYNKVGLWKNKECKQFRVNRLVYMAFNGKIPEGFQVNHIDENTQNDRLDNLNLMTPKENVNWGTRNERHRKAMINNEYTSSCILQLTIDGKLVREWPSLHEAERNGFKHQNICACLKGKMKTHKGYIWKYKN